MNVPFNRLYLGGNELKYIEDAITVKKDIAAGRHYTKLVNEFIESRFGAKKAIMTTSCTRALELATSLLRLGPGDEIIMPSFTFVSTANPVLSAGAKIVFADICEDTLNIDPNDFMRKITPATKAVYVVHYGGVACDMGEITRIARENDIKIVEDAAHGVNAKYKDRYLGTIGDLGCYSFDEAKNYSSGEGGALLINDEGLIESVNIIVDKGTNRGRFVRGER
jgi:dTDP-4-amino-4,6-dideoxygalactose transaminase